MTDGPDYDLTYEPEHIFRVGWPVFALFFGFLAMVVAGLTAAFIVEVDIVQTYKGTIKDDRGRRTVRVPVDARIDAFNFALGDPVRKGDILAQFDTREIDVRGKDIDLAIETACDSLFVSIGILDSIAPLSQPRLHDGCLQATTKAADVIEAVERRYAFEQEKLASELAVLRDELESLQTQERLLVEQKAGVQKIHADTLALSLEGFAPKHSVLRLEGELGRLDEELRLLYQRRSQIPNQQAVLQQDFRLSVQQLREDQYRQISVSIDDLNRLVAERAQLVLEREALTALEAPMDGYISTIQDSLINTAVMAGEDIVVISPTEGVFSAELEVLPGTIGFARPGDLVNIRVNTYPYQRYGYLKGDVKRVIIGKDNGSDKENGRIKVALTDNTSFKLDSQSILKDGLSIEASVITGRRTIASFFFDPLTDSVSRSFGER